MGHAPSGRWLRKRGRAAVRAGDDPPLDVSDELIAISTRAASPSGALAWSIAIPATLLDTVSTSLSLIGLTFDSLRPRMMEITGMSRFFQSRYVRYFALPAFTA